MKKIKLWVFNDYFLYTITHNRAAKSTEIFLLGVILVIDGDFKTIDKFNIMIYM